MKTRLLIIIFLTVSIMIPVNSFAEPAIKTENGFHEGMIEWISRCFMIGSTITVRVTDYDMNIDPDKIEQFNVKVWSDFDLESDFKNRIIDYMVTETGANTGVFDSKVFLTTTDDSPGKRIRVIDNSIVFAKYVDYTVSNAVNSDVIEIFNVSELSVLERNDDGRMSKITYDPCAMELFEKNKDKFDELDIFYPTPLKQIKSEITLDEIQCKENLVLIQKHNGSPACVREQSIPKLIERGWIKNNNSNKATFDDYIINCNNQTNPYEEYECFKDAYSNCHIATVNPEIYTVEGDPIYTTLTITPDCKVQGIADMSTDKFWGPPEIITTQCDKISEDEYTWSMINCDAHNLSKMQFNFQMQLYPQILECEENGDTWIREKFECVGEKESEN